MGLGSTSWALELYWSGVGCHLYYPSCSSKLILLSLGFLISRMEVVVVEFGLQDLSSRSGML